MDDALLVRRFEGLRNLLRDSQDVLDQYRPTGDPAGQVFALDQFHHEGLDAAGVLQPVDRRDVWMIHSGEGFSFALKAGQPAGVIGQRRREDLDGDLPLQLRICRTIDFAHPASAQAGDDFIRTEPGARGHGHRIGVDYTGRFRGLMCLSMVSIPATTRHTAAGLHLSRGVPTAVIQLDFDRLPPDLEVDEKYTQAFVVIRRRGRPVAQVYVPVTARRVGMERVARGLLKGIWQTRWRWAVDDYLGPDPVMPAPLATVAICTRERPDDLARSLEAVAALRPAPGEIIVVDNNPVTDRTREVVARFAGVRYVREDRPGLDAARNRALAEAATAIVAFTDDDAVPEPAWLGQLLQPFEDPRVLCTTGLTLPLELETSAQEWFERFTPFGRGFERLMFDGTRHDPMAISGCGAGANMALRRTVLERVGAFDEALDAGTAAKSGGDHEMFGRILAGGYRLVYEPGAVSWHRHRSTWEELREVLYGYGAGVYAMWTRRLVLEREPGTLRYAFRWFRLAQMPRLWRALQRRPDSVPSGLLFAELRGCVAGPVAYLIARVRLSVRNKRSA